MSRAALHTVSSTLSTKSCLDHASYLSHRPQPVSVLVEKFYILDFGRRNVLFVWRNMKLNIFPVVKK